MIINSVLEALNLNPKEVKIFLKLLELGAQPASNIARICEIPRNTVRSILDKLVKEGIIIKTRRANTQYYATEKRENIVRNLKTQKVRLAEKIDNQIELLEKYGEELTFRNHSQSRPRITFYEGLSGLEKVYEDTLTAKHGLKSWASYDDLIEVMPEYFANYFKRRAKLKIPMRSIHPDTAMARKQQKLDRSELRESALIPPKKFNWQPEIQVYNDKINITSWKEKIGIIIESEEIAQAMRAIFDLSYEAAKTYKTYTNINYDKLVK